MVHFLEQMALSSRGLFIFWCVRALFQRFGRTPLTIPKSVALESCVTVLNLYFRTVQNFTCFLYDFDFGFFEPSKACTCFFLSRVFSIARPLSMAPFYSVFFNFYKK